MSLHRLPPLLSLLLALSVAAVAQPAAQIGKTPDGLRFRWLGPKPASPMPTVLFFSGAVDDGFEGPEYTEAIRTMGSGVLCVTIDIPGFGQDMRDGEPPSIPSWRYRIDHGQDLIGDFVRRTKSILDHLVAERFTDPKHVAIFGTSRGGFLALHFAAADRRISDVAAFAPVTDLLALTEFSKMTNEQPARALATARLADVLAERGVWIVIGSRDFRVSTTSAIAFAERVVESAVARNLTPEVELHVATSDGHRVPPLSYEAAGLWLLRRWQLNERR